MEFIFEIDGALYDEETGQAVMKPEYRGKLVRCKDCKYMRKEDECELWCQAKGWPAQLVRPDDFCSRGERKDV